MDPHEDTCESWHPVPPSPFLRFIIRYVPCQTTAREVSASWIRRSPVAIAARNSLLPLGSRRSTRSAVILSLSVAPVAGRSAKPSDPLAATTVAAPRGVTPRAAVVATRVAVVTPPVAAAAVIPPGRARCTQPFARPVARRQKSPSSRGMTSRSTAGSASRSGAQPRRATAAATKSS